MKKSLLFIITLLTVTGIRIYAQSQLWGTTQSGGANNMGTLYTISSGNTLAIAHDFTGFADGKQPTGSMCFAANGFIYGTTYNGGSTDAGVCFKINPSSMTLTKIHDFDNLSGNNPQYGLIKGDDGNLYGTCTFGGTTGYGVLFQIDPVTDTYSVLYNFNTLSGSSAQVSEMVGNKLYGTTFQNGLNGLGTIFCFDLSSNAFTVLHNNDNTTGDGSGSILQVAGGKLIGTAGSLLSGLNGLGVLYSYDLTTNMRTVLFNFDTLEGLIPSIKFIEGSDGKIYGTTVYGGANDGPTPIYGDGVIFSFDLSNNSYEVLYNMEHNISGSGCQGGMMQAANGLLYATAYAGGAANKGTIYSFDISSNTFSLIDDFTINNGMHPSSTLLEVTIPTSIANFKDRFELNVWPNPAEDYIIINNSDKANTVACIDILGKEIDHIKINGFDKTRIDVSNYPNIFFVKNNQGEVVKVVKN